METRVDRNMLYTVGDANWQTTLRSAEPFPPLIVDRRTVRQGSRVKSALDRLGRSLKDLIETLNLLKDRGVDFISLKPGLTPPMWDVIGGTGQARLL